MQRREKKKDLVKGSRKEEKRGKGKEKGGTHGNSIPREKGQGQRTLVWNLLTRRGKSPNKKKKRFLRDPERRIVKRKKARLKINSCCT